MASLVRQTDSHIRKESSPVRNRSSTYRVTARPAHISLFEWMKDQLLSARSPFRRDFHAEGASANTLRAIVDGNLEELNKHTNDLDAVVNVASTRFHVLDLAWVSFVTTPTDAKYAVLLQIVGEVDASRQLDAYDKFASHSSFTSDRLRALTEQIVLSSRIPIATALALASRCSILSETHIGRNALLLAEAIFCTALSIELLNALKNEHLVALALQVKDPSLGGSALDLALSTKNMLFIADPTVSRILFNIWTIPRYLKEKTFFAPGYIPVQYRLRILLLKNPKQFMETNRVKFQLQMLFLWGYVLLSSYSALARPSIEIPICSHELAVWILGLGFITKEIVDAQRAALGLHCRSGWSYTGTVIWSSLLVYSVVRSLGSQGVFEGSALLDGARIVQWSSQSLFIVLIWMKLTRQFTIFSAVGVLNRTLPLLASYLANFSYFLAIFCMGFGIALVFTVGNEVLSYQTVFGAWFTLYQGALSQFSFGSFTTLETGKRIVAQTLLGVFLLLATLVLLKTMIVAILNNTYSRVRDQSELEYGFGLAELTLQMHTENCSLPAPANLLVYAIALPIRILTLTAFRQKTFRSNDGWKCAYCYSCNPLRNDDQVLDSLKAWFSNQEGCNLSILESLPIQQLELCQTCSSLKAPIGDFDIIREKISFCIFFVAIWLPVTCLLLFQGAMQRSVFDLIAFLSKQITFKESTTRKYQVGMKALHQEGTLQQLRNREKDIRDWVNVQIQRTVQVRPPEVHATFMERLDPKDRKTVE